MHVVRYNTHIIIWVSSNEIGERSSVTKLWYSYLWKTKRFRFLENNCKILIKFESNLNDGDRVIIETSALWLLLYLELVFILMFNYQIANDKDFITAHILCQTLVHGGSLW